MLVLFVGVSGVAQEEEPPLIPTPDTVGSQDSAKEKVINCCILQHRKWDLIDEWEMWDEMLDAHYVELAWVQENFPENHQYEILLLCEIAGLNYLLDQVAHNIHLTNEKLLALGC